MQCFSTIAWTSNVVGVRGIVKGEGSDFVIQASSTLTKKKNFKFLKNYFANFKILLTRLSRLLNLGYTTFSTKFRAVICSLINFKICQTLAL